MRQILLLVLLILVLELSSFAQRGAGSSDQNAAPGSAARPSGGQSSAPARAPASDQLARMRDDLNRLESLNLNMSSEIEFLRDQNLQILLRTNVQMWTILIRDLREQVAREEQRQSVSPPPPTRPAR